MIKQIKNESASKQMKKIFKKQISTILSNKLQQSSIQKKYSSNAQTVNIRETKKINPYLKKFNVRKVIRTQQSLPTSVNKQKYLSNETKFKIPKVMQKQRFQDTIQLLKGSNKKKVTEIKSLNTTINVQKNIKYESHRQQKQQVSFLRAKNGASPYQQRSRFHTLQGHSQQKSLKFNQQQKNIQKKSKYYFLTKFQKQQITQYEIYFPGHRRVSSLKQFTDGEGNAKIYIGDSIMYRYQILKVLGQGSFGQVFKAYDHKKKQEVAIKIIKNNPKFNKQARIQIKILQTALMYQYSHHHNIVKLKHGFFFRGHACLVFELLHINLYEFLRFYSFKGLNLDLIRRLAIQILQGLLFFQKFNIIHCDLKPENILLKQQNKTGIKIIDVGSGCYEQQQIYTYIQSRFYRAPQIIIGIQYTAAIDIWSLACILCELYTGHPIFPGESQQQQILMQMQFFNVPPKQFIDRGTRSHKFFDDDYQARSIPNSKGKQSSPGSKNLAKKLKNCEDTKFISFLQKCFKWIPEQRLKPHEALLDEWILDGLPRQIVNQHIQMVKSQTNQFLF